jgi:hypothetical protein
MGQPSKEARKRYDSKPEVREKQRLALKKRRKENPEKYKEMGRKSEKKRKNTIGFCFYFLNIDYLKSGWGSG